MTHVQGERVFDAPPERVFALLTDPHIVGAAIPSVRDYAIVDSDHWRAKVKPPLPLAPSLTIQFQVQARREPEHAALRAHGAGTDILSSFELSAEGAGTRMRWRSHIQLGGLLARFARGHALEPLAHRQAERVLDRIAAAL